MVYIMHDLIIIGGGPGGVAAGVCAVATGRFAPSLPRTQRFVSSATGKLSILRSRATAEDGPFSRPLSRGV